MPLGLTTPHDCCLEKERWFELFRCLGQGDISVPKITRIRVVKSAARVRYKYGNKKTAVKFMTDVVTSSYEGGKKVVVLLKLFCFPTKPQPPALYAIESQK